MKRNLVIGAMFVGLLAVLGGLRPFRRAERLQPSNQTLAVEDETVEARVEIHP